MLKHGRNGTPAHLSWVMMRQRCGNPNHHKYASYGAKGIKICQRWLESFESFLADMGPRPPGTTLDRWPDNQGNYEPGNCRWATWKEQENNRRNNHRLSYLGETHTIAEWSELLNISAFTICGRVHKGWPAAQALRSTKWRKRK